MQRIAPVMDCFGGLSVQRPVEVLREHARPGMRGGRVATPYGGMCPLPITRLAPAPSPLAAHDLPAFLVALAASVDDRLLAELRRALPRVSGERVVELRHFLADETTARDGWPALSDPTRTTRWATDPMNRALRQQRHGSTARAVMAAVASDLQGLPLGGPEHDEAIIGNDGLPIDISVSRMLGLGDHRLVTRSPGGVSVSFHDPRKAREYQRRGRALLADLGFWPWAHAPRGVLPAGWADRAEFVEPLQAWFEQSPQ